MGNWDVGNWITGFYAGTTAVYTLAMVAHLFLVYRSEWDAVTRWWTRTAWVAHTVTLGLTVAHTGRLPAYTLFEAALSLTWLMVTGYLVYDSRVKRQAAGAILLPVIFLLLLTTAALPQPTPEHEVLQLPVSLVVWHASITLLAYLFFVAAFVAGAMYLLLERQLRRKAIGPLYYRLPSLEALDVWGHRFVAAGVTFLSMGLITGTLFASRIWSGEGWHVDPKILWSFLTWILYVGYLTMRRYWGWGGRRAAWWSIAGFLGVVTNYAIINRFASELHRFGL